MVSGKDARGAKKLNLRIIYFFLKIVQVKMDFILFVNSAEIQR